MCQYGNNGNNGRVFAWKSQESSDQPRDNSNESSSYGANPPALSDNPTINIGSNDNLSNMFQAAGGISPGEPFLGGMPSATEGLNEEPFPWEMIGLGLDEPMPPQDEINEL